MIKNISGSKYRQKMLHTFTVDFDSEVDDRTYKGSFTTKKMSILDLASLGVRKSQLNGAMHHDENNPGTGVDSNTDEFNNMVAHLELSLIEKPDWWKLDEISDINLIIKVYEEVLEFENTFLRSKRQPDEGNGSVDSSEKDSSADIQKADITRVSNDVVDEKVQAALEP